MLPKPSEPDAAADSGDDLQTWLRMVDDWARIIQERREAEVRLERDRAELFQLYLQLAPDDADRSLSGGPSRPSSRARRRLR
jgi:hypothetical protein